MGKKLMFLFLIGFLSCKKSKTNINDLSLKLTFSQQTIAIDKVDSIVVTLAQQGKTDLVTERMNKLGNTYFLKYTATKNADNIISISVFSTEDSQSRRKYVLTKENFNGNEIVAAPIIVKHDKWIPYILLLDRTRGVELMVAERQEHPLVELSISKTKDWDYIYLNRLSLTTLNEVVDTETWETSGNFKGKISNTDTFSSYCERIKNKLWHKSDVLFILMNTLTGEECTFYYIYNQRY
jgi:hypothetical protein